MTANEFHEFHFVLNRRMRNKLQKLDMYRDCGSLSEVIVKIITLMNPMVRREHKWGEEMNSRYLPVCDDPDEIRDHVHVYFPNAVYRELKLLHADLNFFSLAQLVRKFLTIFLSMVKKYGAAICKKLKRIFSQWNKDEKDVKPTPTATIRQLWIIIQHLLGKKPMITIYDAHFSPFWIFRL